jgi:hypothetical protein
MAASKPNVPEDVSGLSDERLQTLHEKMGEHREALRLEHRRILDEMRAREPVTAQQDEPTGGTVGTTSPSED